MVAQPQVARSQEGLPTSCLSFYDILRFNFEARYQMTKLTERVTINADVMMGKPTIRGLRITVEQILRSLAAGVSPEELLADYPELEMADLQAVYAFAGDLVSETRIYLVTA